MSGLTNATLGLVLKRWEDAGGRGQGLFFVPGGSAWQCFVTIHAPRQLQDSRGPPEGSSVQRNLSGKVGAHGPPTATACAAPALSACPRVPGSRGDRVSREQRQEEDWDCCKPQEGSSAPVPPLSTGEALRHTLRGVTSVW